MKPPVSTARPAVQVYLRIYLPLMMPALAIVAIYALLLSWNDYVYQFALLSTRNMTASVMQAQLFTDADAAVERDDGCRNHLCATALCTVFRPPTPHDDGPDDVGRRRIGGGQCRCDGRTARSGRRCHPCIGRYGTPEPATWRDAHVSWLQWCRDGGRSARGGRSLTTRSVPGTTRRASLPIPHPRRSQCDRRR